MKNEMKSQFIKNLQEAPYDDDLINSWLKTFQDNNLLEQFIEGCESVNSEWSRLKDMCSKEQFIMMIEYEYKIKQNIPHLLFVAMMMNVNEELRDLFVANEFLKNMKIYDVGNTRVYDMSGGVSTRSGGGSNFTTKKKKRRK